MHVSVLAHHYLLPPAGLSIWDKEQIAKTGLKLFCIPGLPAELERASGFQE